MSRLELMVLVVSILSVPAGIMWLYNEVLERMGEYEDTDRM